MQSSVTSAAAAAVMAVVLAWKLELTPGFYPGSNEQRRMHALGVFLKRTCSRVTSASSALGVLNDYALYTNHARTHSRVRNANVYVVQTRQSWTSDSAPGPKTSRQFECRQPCDAMFVQCCHLWSHFEYPPAKI